VGLGSGHVGCDGNVVEGVSHAPFLFDMLNKTANVASSERPGDPRTQYSGSVHQVRAGEASRCGRQQGCEAEAGEEEEQEL
jgi:hypothetical protein